MKHKNLMTIILLVIMAAFSLALSAQHSKTATIISLPGAGTDYQIRFTAHYATGTDVGEDVYLEGNCRADFADVRFFEGSTELSYWMESKTDGDSAIFWVKLAGDLSSNNLPVTVKYGNMSASTTSNGDATFIFFDDFSGDLSKWTIYKRTPGTNDIFIPAGEHYVRCYGGPGGNQVAGNYGFTALRSEPTYNAFLNNAIEYRYQVCATGISEVGFRGNFTNNTGYKARSDARTGEGQSFQTPPYQNWDPPLTGFNVTDKNLPSAGTWYRGTITAFDSQLKFRRAGGTGGPAEVINSLGNLHQAGEISLQNHFGEFSDYDWVAVRKFAGTEPVRGPWGEDTLPVELSSFTGSLNAHNNVVLTWVTQSETGVMGFYVYRNTNPILANAQQISHLINATNTADQQVYVYTDDEANQIGTYYYWLMSADMDGSESFYGPLSVTYESPQPGSPGIPLFTGLNQIYPNPFNPSANISYELAKPGDVLITIYNSRGQVVRSFERNNVAAGSWNLIWNGKDQNGNALSSGVYYIRMQAGQDSFMKKAVLMK